MSSLKFSFIFVFLFCLSSSLFSFTSAVDPNYLYHFCSDNNFTRNSTYQSNLNSLLSSLPSSNCSYRFYRDTAGQGPSRVYGLYQCRGDLPTTTCQDCVAFASTEVTIRCPANKGAIIWFDECYFRFLDTNFFYDKDLQQSHLSSLIMWNTQNVTIEPAKFHELLWDMMESAASEAEESPKKFPTKKQNFTEFQTMYCLVQCTEDLWIKDCHRCLQTAIGKMQTGTIGGRVLLPMCISRYEVYPFYDENSTASPPLTSKPSESPPSLLPITPTSSPPFPPSPVTRLKGKV